MHESLYMALRHRPRRHSERATPLPHPKEPPWPYPPLPSPADAPAGPDGTRVTNEELFFDLAYVFLVTQISHGLLHHLNWMGGVQTLILWFAAWLGWQHTGWVTNWFDPRVPALRG
ncbi:low temperature requirement protein A [Komagataeibacter rhaeticus]|nr:low temperature requirement protein A [Komagataeibacter rhaeticus]